jgi:hypothetical protein
MTDIKISDLTSASTVEDADVFPLVQSGDTKKATIALMKAAVAPDYATETDAGIIEIANTTEAISGSNDDKAMTSLKVQEYIDNGVVSDGATGGNQGVGTINTKGLFINGEPVSAGGSAGMEVIATSTPTGVATVTFSAIPQTYRGLLLTVESVSCATATRHFYARCYTDGGTESLPPSGFQVVSGTTATLLAGVTSNVFGTPPTQGAADLFAGSFRIYNYQQILGGGVIGMSPRPFEAHYNSPSQTASVRGELTNRTSDDTGLDTIVCGWNSTGNFDAGTITLYGIK